MKKLLVGLVLLVALLALVVELVAPQLAASSIEDHVRNQTEGVVGVSAEVGPFPVVTRLLATERVQRLAVTLDEVAAQQLTFSSVRIELRGVELDRNELLDGNVRVRGMQGGQATATVDANALTEALGVPVRVEDDQLFVEVAGTEIEVPVGTEGDPLGIPAGLSDIALPDVVSCTDVTTAVANGRVELSCALQDVPSILS